VRKYLVQAFWSCYHVDEWAYTLEGAHAVRDMALSRGAVSAKIYELTEVE
jgi:hypothetical protein